MIYATLVNEVIITPQSGEELRTFACGVEGIDTELAGGLQAFAELVDIQGLRPDSSRFMGRVAADIMQGLHELQNDTVKLRAAHAAIMLAEAAEPTTCDEASWLGRDIIVKIQALLSSPHSAAVEFHTDTLDGRRRVPVIIS